MTTPTLVLERLDVNIGRVPILRSVSLTVPSGSIVGLVGHNGAGRTTTLRTVMGLLPRLAGRIRLDGVDISDASPRQRAMAGIGYMPEERRLLTGITVEDNIRIPAWSLRLADEAQRLAMIFDVIPELRPLAQRTAEQLSGGQQKLVALARAFMYGRRLLLLDEPFEGVAPALADRLGEVVQAFSQQGVSVLLAESDATRLEALADIVYTIERGEIRDETVLRAPSGVA
ncbi:MAG TPA: ATP-binding cassette domain-containing protein [Limnochordales bacterium]|nr:ATP-binding cassette domain-containing protein [Limnochordales bacterium]